MKLNRRSLLKAGGLVTASGALALGTGQVGTRLMETRRVAQSQAPAAPAGALPLPPLPVTALSRLAFGPSPGSLAAFVGLPGRDDTERLSAWLDLQLHPEKIDDSACQTRLRAARLDTLDAPIEALWKKHYVDAPKEGDARWQTIVRPTQQLRTAALIRMVYSQRQLYEVLVNFWRDHFNVNPDKDERIFPVLPVFERDALRAHALGNFRDLLGAVARSPAMLYYLDNASSSRAGPNENYARELFELHTLGAQNYAGVQRQSSVPREGGLPVAYVDDDVYEATRAFTGWRVGDDPDEPGLGNSGAFVFHLPWHDRFQKTVLGRYLPPNQGIRDGEAVLDALATHPGTAHHLAQKLTRRLIADNPPERVVAEAARVFLAQQGAPDQLRQVVGVIARSKEFAGSWGSKIKRPLEATAATLRALEAEFQTNDDTLWLLDWMGQPLYGHRPPDGYSDDRAAWSGSLAMARRWQLARALTHNWNDQVKVNLLAAHPQALRTPTAIAEHWSRRLLGRPLTGAGQQAVTRVLAWDGDPSTPLDDQDLKDRLPEAVSFIVMSPEFQAC